MGNRVPYWVCVAFVVASFLFVICTAADAPKVEVVAVEMSKCPYCSLWKQNFQATVMSKEGLPDIISFTEWFIATENVDNITCLHGPGECVGNRILLCAHNLTITKSEWGYWNYGVCMQADYTNIPDNAPACAEKTGMPWKEINECASGALGLSLFKDSIAKSVSLQVKSTPTVFVGPKMYVGGPNNPLAIICNAYTGTKPPGCPQ